MENSITIDKEDFILAPIGDYDIIYTTAAVNDTFNWKLFYFSILSKGTYFIFSRPISKTFKKKVNVQIEKLCQGHLATSDPNINGEKRDIMFINLEKVLIKEPNILKCIINYGRTELQLQFVRVLQQEIFSLFDKITVNLDASITWAQLDRSSKLPWFNSLPALSIVREEPVATIKNKLQIHFKKGMNTVINQIFSSNEEMSEDEDIDEEEKKE